MLMLLFLLFTVYDAEPWYFGNISRADCERYLGTVRRLFSYLFLLSWSFGFQEENIYIHEQKNKRLQNLICTFEAIVCSIKFVEIEIKR